MKKTTTSIIVLLLFVLLIGCNNQHGNGQSSTQPPQLQSSITTCSCATATSTINPTSESTTASTAISTTKSTTVPTTQPTTVPTTITVPTTVTTKATTTKPSTTKPTTVTTTAPTTKPTTVSTTMRTTEPVDESALPEPYVYLAEGSQTSVYSLNWPNILAKIPSDHYVEYPGLYTEPLTATLYIDGVATELDTMDPRLVQFINFYNNTFYYGNYSHATGGCSDEGIAELEARPTQLVLTYHPIRGSTETLYHTVYIANSYTGVALDNPFTVYPHMFAKRTPLHQFADWLKIFGFYS